MNEGELEVKVLGSGFFVSPTMFLTCHHVLNSTRTPHRDGDRYVLARNEGGQVTAHRIASVETDRNLFLRSELDAALLDCSGIKPNDYVSLSFGNINDGQEIGVYGYPLARLAAVDNQIDYSGLVPRVSKGIVTAQFTTNLRSDEGVDLRQVQVIEVNFLFVPGNSGGPVFDAKTGRVIGYVYGYNDVKIRDKLETSQIDPPEGQSRQYIRATSAVYSYAISVFHIQDWLKEYT